MEIGPEQLPVVLVIRIAAAVAKDRVILGPKVVDVCAGAITQVAVLGFIKHNRTWRTEKWVSISKFLCDEPSATRCLQSPLYKIPRDTNLAKLSWCSFRMMQPIPAHLS